MGGKEGNSMRKSLDRFQRARKPWITRPKNQKLRYNRLGLLLSLLVSKDSLKPPLFEKKLKTRFKLILNSGFEQLF